MYLETSFTKKINNNKFDAELQKLAKKLKMDVILVKLFQKLSALH